MDNNKPVTELPVKAPFDFAKWWDRVGILIVLLVLLILFLAGYALFGYGLQMVAHGLMGSYLPTW